MGTAAAAQPNKQPRWAEMADDEAEEGLAFLLPPKQEIGPNEKGVKKIIEYKFNDEGHRVKTTTTTTTIRVRKLADRLISNRAVERRAWSKFGDVDDGGSSLTMVSNEEIIIERPRPHGSKQEETKIAGDPLQASTGVLMVCRTCGRKGAHWTAQCPDKDLSRPHESFMDKPLTHDTVKVEPGPGTSSYVPPNRRSNNQMRERNGENSVRVNNISEDTTEPDLVELFQPFGPLSRTCVPLDKNTGRNRGFGFVNFVNREDAERAMNKLNGYGYDNLILRVEWAAPRAH